MIAIALLEEEIQTYVRAHGAVMRWEIDGGMMTEEVHLSNASALLEHLNMNDGCFYEFFDDYQEGDEYELLGPAYVLVALMAEAGHPTFGIDFQMAVIAIRGYWDEGLDHTRCFPIVAEYARQFAVRPGIGSELRNGLLGIVARADKRNTPRIEIEARTVQQ